MKGIPASNQKDGEDIDAHLDCGVLICILKLVLLISLLFEIMGAR